MAKENLLPWWYVVLGEKPGIIVEGIWFLKY
jgi:hypothetical protein